MPSFRFSLGVRPAAALAAFLFASASLINPSAWAGPAPVAGTSASATVTGTSPVTMHFPLTRSGDSAYAAWIRYATRDGTAIAGSDYTAASGAVEVPAGATGASIPVQALGASSYSSDKQFTLKLLGAAGVGPTPSFAAQQSFATGNTPYSVTTADVNGDGKADLIVANKTSSGTVSVLLNTTAPGATTPSFATHVDFATGSYPYSVTAADVNGDGKPDLIVTNQGSATVSVLLNTTAPGATAPSFAAQQSFTTGSNPASVTAADVNGDGKPDLIVANYSDNNVSVLLNTTAPGASTPSFAAQQTFATGSIPLSVTAADVNNDGKPDIIVANYRDNNVSVLLNTTTPGASTPSFATQQSFTTGSIPYSVTAADVNGDGKPDLIVADSGSASVSLLLNTTAPGAASPSFAAQQSFATGSYPESVTAADVNGDGKADLIVANNGSNTVSLLLNTTAPGATAPSFAAQQTFATGSRPYSVTAADVNGDGQPDLIAANSRSNTVSVLLNTTAAPTASAPSFAAQQSFATGSAPFSVTAADVNGDGKPDLIVANNTYPGTVSVLLNTTAPGASTSSVAAQQSFATGSGSYAVTAADVNGDGRPDLIVVNEGSSTVSVLLNTTAPGATTPSFATHVDFTTGSYPESVTTADVNGDGKPDLIVTNSGSASASVSVLLNTTAPGASAPGFAAQQSFTTGSSPYSVTAADVNGDGQPDLIVASYNDNTVSVLLNTTAPGAATPSFAAQQSFTAGTNPYSVTAADVNGDGKPDLIVANYRSSTVSVLLNTTAPGATTPSFAAQQSFAAGSAPHSVTAADVDGDDRPDLIVANYNNPGTVSMLLNTTASGASTPSFATQQTFATGGYPISLTAADVNGDGKPDLIVTNSASASVSVLLNTQYAATVSPTSVTGTIHYQIPGAAFSPDLLAFGNVAAGSSSTRTVALTNNGNASLTLASIAIGGIDAARFTQSNNCPGSLAAGAQCAVQVSYAPNALTTDNATLSVSSNAPSSPDTVALSGTGADKAPTANNGSVTTTTDTAVNGTLGASDPDSGQSLTYSIVTQPTHGTVTITDAATGAFTYTPASGYAGSDAFAFKTNDGYKSSNTATESLIVDDTAPIAINGNVSTATGTAVNAMLSAADLNSGQTLTYSIVSQPAHGTVTITDANIGAFTYTPASGYAGSDSFTFKANDGYEDSNTATESVTVNSTGGGGGFAGSGGGGGSLSALALMLFLSLVAIRYGWAKRLG